MIRFVNETGIGRTTEILNADTGENLTRSLSIGYGGTITIGKRITAELPLAAMVINVTASKTAWKTKNPISGCHEELAALEFRDGTRVEFAADGTPRAKAAA